MKMIIVKEQISICKMEDDGFRRINDEIILNRIETARLISPDGSFIDMFGREMPYVINRVKLDRSYYTRAVDVGARFFIEEISFLKSSLFKKPLSLSKTDVICS